jgi:DNA-binding transcriptional regulator GbsR (MarR family)
LASAGIETRTVVTQPLSSIEKEVVSLAMRAGQILGLPKSVGAIYGLLYLSPQPLTMEEIMGRLRISLGSASQGLRQLRSFKAVRAVYVPGARREHFEAEDQFRKLIGSFLDDEVGAQLDSASESLANLAKLVEQTPMTEREWLRQRVEKLESVNTNARRLLTLVARFLT